MESNAGLTSYELRVKRNIEENQRVLKSLGLLKPIGLNERKEASKKTVRRLNVADKRKSSCRPNEESPASFIPARRTRRSTSLLKAHGFDESDDASSIDACDEENMPPNEKKREAPKPIFGPIEDVSVGDWWATRIECSAAGVHRPTVAGIHGKLEEGCYSLALSGGYEDDIDYGECFTYTGSGGRDLKGTKTNPKNLRTAPQTKDQVLEGPNAALALNIENRRPVRVIRGYKLPSPYAPEEGYRYDGLYSVERSWTATGLSGYKVYKFALKRLPDQDPPPWLSNGSNIPAQNGYTDTESRQNGVQEKRHGEEHKHMQTSASDSHTKSSVNIPSNSLENISEDTEFMDTSTQATLKRKRTSSNSKFSPKGTRDKSKSPIKTPKSTQNIPERMDVNEKHSQVKLKRSRRSSGSNLDLEGHREESKIHTHLQNPTQNSFEDKEVAGNHPELAPKRKRTLSDSKIDTKKTREEFGSPTNLNATTDVVQDKNSIENISQTTLEINPSTNTITNHESIGQRSKSSIQGKLEDSGNKSTLIDKFTELKDSNTNEIKTPYNQQTNINHYEVGIDALLPLNRSLQDQLTPLRNGKKNHVNTSHTDKIEQKNTTKLTNSIEKKVRFSPEVYVNHADGNKSTKPILSLDSENKSRARKLNYPTKLCDLREPNENVYPEENSHDQSDSKKQTSILNYFGPLKKPSIKKPISRGILLRGNKRSFDSSVNNICNPELMNMKYCTVPLIPITTIPRSQQSTVTENKSTQLKRDKSLFNKRNSSSDKSETELFQMYENTNNSVKKENNLLSTITLSPVKPCSVVLNKLETEQYSSPLKAIFVSPDKKDLENFFLGWDRDINEVNFLGFDLDEELHQLFCGFEENTQLSRDLEDMRSVVVEEVSVTENSDVSKV